MSVETAINNLISSLRSTASNYRGEATALIAQAGAALSALSPPDVPSVEYEVDRETAELARIPRPATIGEITPFVAPDFSGVQDITPVDETFSESLGSLNLPSAVITRLDTLPEFTTPAPNLPTLEITPDFDLLSSEPSAPGLTTPQPFTADPLSGTAPEVDLPQFAEFEGQWWDEYLKGLGYFGDDLRTLSDWLRDLYRERIQPLDALFSQRLQAIMASEETAVTDAWESGKYDQARQPIAVKRYEALLALDGQPSSVTGLPEGSRAFARAALEVQVLQETMQAGADTALARRDREVTHLQWAMQTAEQWVEAALALKAQEIGWRLKAMMIALDGAEGALDLALQVLENKKREVGYFNQYNDIQIRRTEDQIKIERTKLDALQVTLASNERIASYNDHQQTVYQVALGLVETRIKGYLNELEFLSTTKQLELLKLQIYEAEVKAFSAQVQGYAAEQAAFKARIKGDLSLTEGELGKVRQYQAQVKGFQAEVAAKKASVKAQSAQNSARLQEYVLTLEGQLTQLRTFDTAVQIAVKTLIKGFDAEATEKELQLREQAFLDETTLEDAMRELRREQLEINKELAEYQIRLQQRQSEGAIINQGASTTGGIAAQAFGGLNAVATTSIVEEA